jgi:hypothetical protein
MNQDLATQLIMLIVWVISLVAGITFIRQAFLENKARQSKLENAVNEIKFRLRLAMGLGLVIWVIGGIVWMLTN